MPSYAVTACRSAFYGLANMCAARFSARPPIAAGVGICGEKKLFKFFAPGYAMSTAGLEKLPGWFCVCMLLGYLVFSR